MKSWLKKGAGIAFTDGKSLLMLKRSESNGEGTWCLPGGRAKEGETEIGNAIRETREEIGVDSIPGHRFDSFSNRSGQEKFTMFFYHVAKPFEVKLSDEHSEHKWVPLNELDSLDLHPKLKPHMGEYLRKIRRKLGVFSEWVRLTETIQRMGNDD